MSDEIIESNEGGALSLDIDDLFEEDSMEEGVGNEIERRYYRISYDTNRGQIEKSEDEFTEKVNFVLIGHSTPRIWSPPHGETTGDDEFNYFCFSKDGICPAGTGASAQDGPCVQLDDNGVPVRDSKKRRIPICPKAIWEDGKPSPCESFYKLFCLDLNDNCYPFIWNAKGTQNKAFRQFLMKRSREIARLKRKSPEKLIEFKNAGVKKSSVLFKCSITVTPIKTYFLPNFEIEDINSPEDAAKYYAFYETIKDEIMES